MTRIVVDTNVLVSAAIREQGAEAIVLDLVAAHQLALYVSEGNKRHFPAKWKNTQVANARELVEMVTQTSGPQNRSR